MRFLTDFWEAWKRLGKRIGDFQARLLLTIFYFVILAPFAVVLRWGTDPLSLKRGGERWHSSTDRAGAPLERARNQF